MAGCLHACLHRSLAAHGAHAYKATWSSVNDLGIHLMSGVYCCSPWRKILVEEHVPEKICKLAAKAGLRRCCVSYVIPKVLRAVPLMRRLMSAKRRALQHSDQTVSMQTSQCWFDPEPSTPSQFCAPRVV